MSTCECRRLSFKDGQLWDWYRWMCLSQGPASRSGNQSVFDWFAARGIADAATSQCRFVPRSQCRQINWLPNSWRVGICNLQFLVIATDPLPCWLLFFKIEFTIGCHLLWPPLRLGVRLRIAYELAISFFNAMELLVIDLHIPCAFNGHNVRYDKFL